MIKEKLEKYRTSFHQLRRQYLEVLNAPAPIYGPSTILNDERERYRQQMEVVRKKVQKLVTIMRSVPESLRLTIMKKNENNYAPNELTHSQILKDMNDLMEEIAAVLSRQPETPAAEKKTSSAKKSTNRKRKRDNIGVINSVMRRGFNETQEKMTVRLLSRM